MGESRTILVPVLDEKQQKQVAKFLLNVIETGRPNGNSAQIVSDTRKVLSDGAWQRMVHPLCACIPEGSESVKAMARRIGVAFKVFF